MKLEEKLALDKFDVDKDVHITIDQGLCTDCDLTPCIYACPAECYAWREDHITFSYEGCLECGSCRMVCSRGAIRWVYPRGGFGICYQYG